MRPGKIINLLIFTKVYWCVKLLDARNSAAVVAEWLRRPSRTIWRNWLVRSAVNRKVGGSSPPGGAKYFFSPYCCEELRNVDLGRIRTCNLLIRSQTRYPLRHETKLPDKETCPSFTKPVFF